LARGEDVEREFTDSTADSTFTNRTSDLHYPVLTGEFSELTNEGLATALREAAYRSTHLSGGEIEDYQTLPRNFHKYALGLACEALLRLGDVPLNDLPNIDHRGILEPVRKSVCGA
jgi:hypothetical protein